MNVSLDETRGLLVPYQTTNMSRSRFLLVPFLIATSAALAERHQAAERPIAPGAPRLTAELPVSEVTYDRGYSGDHPHIAAGPNQALVIWSNGVVRVDSNGAPLDVLPLMHGAGYPEGPQDVAWNGSSYTVATTHFDSKDNLVIGLVNVDVDGRVSPTIDLDRAANPNVRVAVAVSGERTAVVYYVARNDGNADMIALLVEKGVVVQRITLATDGPWSSPRVVASPYGFLVLWIQNFRLIDSNGNVLGGTLKQTYSDAVWNGNAFMAASSESGALTMFPIFPNGAVGASTVIHPATTLLMDVVNPAIAWNGTEYGVLWQQFNRTGRGGTYDLRSARVSTSLTVVEESSLRQSIWYTDSRFVPPADSDAIASIHQTFIPVWGSGIPTSGGGVRTIYTSTLSDFDQNARLISQTAAAQQIQGLVAQAGSARVFWYQNDRFLTSTVAPNGRRDAASAVQVGNFALFAWNGFETVAASNGGTQGANTILATFIDEDGVAGISRTLVQSPTYVSVTSLSCNDDDCALVWRQYDANNGNPRDFFQRFTFNGVPIGEPLQLAAGFMQMSGRANEYLLVFRWAGLFATRYADGKLSDVTDLQSNATAVAIAAKPDGWLVGAAPLVIRLSANAAIEGRTELPATTPVSLAWDGRFWIAAWMSNDDIRAARIRADGTIAGEFLAAGTAENELNPVLRSNGNGLTALAYTRTTDDRLYGISSRVFVRWIDSR